MTITNEKEKKLIDKIEKAKNYLEQLQTKRKLEIGKLAYKYCLEALSDNELEKAFHKLSKELSHENK